jgi:curved DNA-binding protein CbpA
MESYYDLLEVEPSATSEDIGAAFRRLAKKHHPDMNAGREQEARLHFVRVLEAYSVLSDPRRRALYDARQASGDPWGAPKSRSAYEIQPLDDYLIDPASEVSVTLPRLRRRLDPQLRTIIVFAVICFVLGMLIVLIAW